jgi:uncharacterized coiled-coil DUF342 family protein
MLIEIKNEQIRFNRDMAKIVKEQQDNFNKQQQNLTEDVTKLVKQQQNLTEDVTKLVKQQQNLTDQIDKFIKNLDIVVKNVNFGKEQII